MSIDVQPRPDTTEDESTELSRATRLTVTLVVAAVSILVVWAAAPEAVSATFSGPGTFFRVLAVFAGFVLFSAVVRRVVPNPWVARAVVAVPAIAVTWWALSPYVGDDVVNEDFPVVADTPASGVTPDADETDSGSADEPSAAAAVPSEPSTDASAGETSQPSAESPPPPPSEPVALASGGFQGLTGHRGAGNATIYELPDGSRIVRLEDFDVSNGPGLEIHLVPGADQRGPGGGVKLADLRGNVGNQNYDVPADLDLAGDWTVLIWCEPFTVEVANATTSFG